MLRAGFGIYYNPNQMNSFTFLTNNPPLAAVTTYTLGSGQPDVVVLDPDWSSGTGGTPRRHLADAATCPTRGRISGASTCSASSGGRRRWISSTSVRTPVIWIAASSTTRRRLVPAPSIRGGRARSSAAAASSRTTSIADYDAFSIILRKRMSHGLQARRALHVVAHPRHGHALERRRPDDGQLRHLAGLRPGELGRPAPLRRQLSSTTCRFSRIRRSRS